MTTTVENMMTISEIANRANESKINLSRDKFSLVMDIEYTNEVIPLDLAALLAADDFNFTHDIIGIQRNFNRSTLQMDNCFLPRYAARIPV